MDVDRTPETAPEADRPGHVEVRGIELIPDEDRHGTPRELFWIWLSANTAFTYIFLGGLMILLGLNVWQALSAIIVGNLFYVLIGVLATPGPRAATAQIMISRAQYGRRGNQLSTLLQWVNLIGFEAINFSIGAFALYSLADFAGWNLGDAGKGLLLGIVILVTFAIALLGHATIVVFQKWFAYALGLAAILLFVFVAGDAHLDYQAATPLHGTALLAVWLLGVTIIASAPLSWCGMAADYTRYMRPDTEARPIVFNTTVGCLIPCIGLSVLAVLAGTAVDMTDPTTSMRPLMPHWFYPLFLGIVVVGSITNNVLGVYSSGLSLQTLGLKVPRWQSIWIDALIGGAMTVYAIFISNFLDTLTEFLQFMIWWYAPYTAIFLIDMWFRHNRYDGAELHRVGGGRYWYRAGFNWRGLTALVGGMAAAALFANTTHWQSPISTDYLNNTDVSVWTGFIVGGVLYYALMRGYASEAEAERPAVDVEVAGLGSEAP
jgi:NCS1 family nucleobase:cation symporter-1